MFASRSRFRIRSFSPTRYPFPRPRARRPRALRVFPRRSPRPAALLAAPPLPSALRCGRLPPLQPLLERHREDLLRPHARALGAKGLKTGPQVEVLPHELALHEVHDLGQELPVLVQFPIQVFHMVPYKRVLICTFGLLGIWVRPRRGHGAPPVASHAW